MADMVVICSGCGKEIKLDGTHAGTSMICPHCSRSVAVPAAGRIASRDLAPISTPLTRAADKVLQAMRFFKGRPARFRAYRRAAAELGVYAIPVAGIVFALQFFILSIRADRMSLFLIGLLGLAIALPLHYLAARFALSGAVILEENPQSLAQVEFPDLVGLASLIGAVVILLGGIVTALVMREFMPLVYAAMGAFVWANVALLSLNPAECLNLRTDSTRLNEGQMLLAIMTFLARCVLALVPIALGVVALAGTIWVTVDCFKAAYAEYPDITTSLWALLSSRGAAAMIAWAGIIPLVGYLYYLVMMLVINLCQAVLARGSRQAA